VDPDRRLDATMARGLYPELWRVPDLSASDFFAGYVAAYLERDVRQLLNVTSLRDFERFVRILAARSGQVLNKSDVARDVGVSGTAITQWLSVLQASNLIVLLEPYFQNIGKRMIKSPKVYFTDPGLLCFLLGLDEASLPSSPYLGAVWEATLLGELQKHINARGVSGKLWFYRDERNREVDFVLERSGRLSFIEAKWTETPDAATAKTITLLDAELRASALRVRAGEHFVVCRTQHSHPLGEHVRALPFQGLTEVFGAA
jgi:predicted AAA+ superfamily ATPase